MSRPGTTTASSIVLSALVLAIVVSSIQAGGPRNVDGTGQPMRWDNGIDPNTQLPKPLVFNADQGSAGLLNKTQADALLAGAFARWSGLPLVSLSFSQGPDLPYDVNAVGLPATNPAHWAHFWRKDGDGLNPVIYDPNGDIVDSMFGVGVRFHLLGAEGMDNPISLSGRIMGASMVINGAYLDGQGPPGSPTDSVSDLAFSAIMAHEIGHWLGLDHAMPNHELAEDSDPDNDSLVPTMYPLTVLDEEAIATPQADDEAAAVELYPAPGVSAQTWSLSGVVRKGTVPFQGAQIIVRRVGDPLARAYEAISGARFAPCEVGGVCYPCDPNNPCVTGDPDEQGAYSISGMVPGEYTVCLEQLDRTISLENGTSIGPLATPAEVPAAEECWTTGDSADPITDDPDVATPLTQAAGSSATDVDIVLDDLSLLGSDPFEPNDSLAAAADLPALVALQPQDTVAAILTPATDVDFYKVSVVAGHTYQIDVDASEIGTPLDPVLTLFDNTNSFIQSVDDDRDPDSRMQTPDPAITYQATFTGLLRIRISSFGGVTEGRYWLRVIHDPDADDDGIADRLDVCPADAADDVDHDGFCGDSDNCSTVYNPGQANGDADPLGDACDNNQALSGGPSVVPNARESDVVNARFGTAVAGVGDIDADGFQDILMGAPFWSDPNGTRGAFYVNYGTPAGRMSGVRWSSTADDPPGAYGASATGIGDQNCDGFADFIVGDPIDRCFDFHVGAPAIDGFTKVGACYDGGDSTRQSFAYSLADVGDVNGDGGVDLVVGDPNHPAGGTSRGRAYLFLGVPAASCDPNSALDTTPDWTADGDPNNALFGYAVARAGHVNGDPYGDVLVGAPGYSNGESGEGKVVLYLGSSSSPYLSPSTWSVESDQAGAGLGSAVAGGMDLNGDGHDDIVVGAPYYEASGADRGRVLVYYGSSTGPFITPAVTLDGEADNDHFGSSVAVLDVNGDGKGDVAVGAPEADAGGTDRGKAYVYLGSSSGLSATPARILQGDQNNAHFGGSLASVDLASDGRADLVVAAKDYDNGQTDEGRIFVFQGADGSDRDGDGVVDVDDNCRDLYNPTQQDSDTAAGPDGSCGSFDDNFSLNGPDGACGTADDRAGDGVGDACVSWPLISSFTTPGYRTLSVAWGDYDNDGDLDVWMSGVATGTTAPERLFRNDGGGVFTEVTTSPLTSNWNSGAWADYDNDGNLDLVSIKDIVSGGVRLLKNTGGGSFSSVSLPALASPKWVSWVDFDDDGDLDIYVTTGAAGGRFFQNVDPNSNNFTLFTPTGPGSTNHIRAAWQDFDGDGDQDVYVGTSPCQLFRNAGSGSFLAVTTVTPHFCDSFDWGDYDNDGDPDIVSGWQIIRNESFGASTSIVGALDTGVAVARWADYDNDGDLDILRGPIQRNDGNNVFNRADEATTRTYGTAFHALADYDGDGRLDELMTSNLTNLVRCRIAHNQVPDAGHWLEIDLRGTVSNRSAIGARVTAVAGGVTHYREVTSGSASAPLRLHFGLGDSVIVDSLEIRWPSGTLQVLTNVPVDQWVTLTESDGTAPYATAVLPRDGAVDTSTYTNIVFQMSEPIDPLTADLRSVSVSRAGVKVAGAIRVSSDRRVITFDPSTPLDPDADYVVQLTADAKDLAGNAAAASSTVFDTGSVAASAPLTPDVFGGEGPGSTLVGQNADDRSGYSAAAVGDVNGDGVADMVIGSPNTDVGLNADAGTATLVFGQSGLQSSAGSALSIRYHGEAAYDHAGLLVSEGGDINEDSLADFFVGAPLSSPHGAGSGKAYLVFGRTLLDDVAPADFFLGDLAACASPQVLCGIVFEGPTAGDMAGASIAAVGDINHDGHRDILIAAPHASLGGVPDAGAIYLIYGPLTTPGTISLSEVGITVPGRVFIGENEGDNAGTSVSGWDQYQGDGIDDLLIGAPSADATDEYGTTKTDVGFVYAIHGGSGNLTADPNTSGTISLSRVANGLEDMVDGVVFIGTSAGGEIGRSVTGAVDINGDGQPDIMLGGDGVAWLIPGVNPKSVSGTSKLSTSPTLSPSGLIRSVGTSDAIQQFSATAFTPGSDGNIGAVSVAPAGDVNGDGIDDVVLGAPAADLPGKPDAGKAYIIFGSPVIPSGEIHLSDVGTAIPGVVIEGAEAGDQLGGAVSGGFDLNADGFSDVVVGAPFADSQPSTPADAGETYVISLLPAAEVIDLQVEAVNPPGTVLLEWPEANRAIEYNIYRGLASSLRLMGRVKTAQMTQLACGANGDSDADLMPDFTDSAIPPSDEAFFYLVTGRNLFGESPLGDTEGAPVRLNDSQCP